MMRVLAFLAVAAVAVSTVIVPLPAIPVTEMPPTRAPAPYAVCPLAEAARRSTILAFSGDSGEVSARVFSGGEFTTEARVSISEAGTGRLDLSTISGLDRSPVLLAWEGSSMQVEALLTGAGAAAVSCEAGSTEPAALLGGSTNEGESFVIYIANPFAGAATVDVVAASEVGPESDSTLGGLVVPPRSLVGVDLTRLFPGRLALSAAVAPTRGRVVVGAIQEGGGDIAAVHGLTAESDWYVPVPSLEAIAAELVLFAPGSVDVPFQLDVYGPEGLIEAAYEEVVPLRGQATVPLADLLTGPGVVRVVAAAPVAAAIRHTGEGTRAITPGVTTPSAGWRLPGAGLLGTTTLLVFNPGELDATARVFSASGAEVATLEVAAGSLATANVEATGLRLEADGEVVLTWIGVTPDGVAGDRGRPASG